MADRTFAVAAAAGVVVAAAAQAEIGDGCGADLGFAALVAGVRRLDASSSNSGDGWQRSSSAALYSLGALQVDGMAAGSCTDCPYDKRMSRDRSSSRPRAADPLGRLSGLAGSIVAGSGARRRPTGEYLSDVNEATDCYC